MQHQKTGLCAQLKLQAKSCPKSDHSESSIESKEENQDNNWPEFDDVPILPVKSPPRKKAVSRLELQAIEGHDLLTFNTKISITPLRRELTTKY